LSAKLKRGRPKKSDEWHLGDAPPEHTEINIPYSPHVWQAPVHTSDARFRILPAGRKFGKTTMCSLEAFRYLGKHNAIVWWVAPYQGLAMIGWRRFLSTIPPIAIRHIDRKYNAITMINGSTISFKTADNPESLLGEGLDFLIMDEAARVKESTWLEMLRPNLDDPGRIGNMMAISTPLGKGDWFYNAWLWGQQRKYEYESWHLPYKSIDGGIPSWKNPYFKKSALQEAMMLPDMIFYQEYAARFVEDFGEVFRDIRKAIKGTLEPPSTSPDYEYVAGVDWGKSGDYTVVTILDQKGHLVAYDQMYKQSYQFMSRRVAETLKSYKARALVESTGMGDPIFEMLEREYPNVTPFNMTNTSKGDIIENLAIMIERGAKGDDNGITYPEIPELILQLQAFGMKQKTTGTIKYSAPKGFHDDYVISLALAAWLLRKGSIEIGIEFFDPSDVGTII
jgi:hypothetical protein